MSDSGGVSDRGDAGQGGVASELGGDGGVAGERAGAAGETSSAGSAGSDTGGRAPSTTGGKPATGGARATGGAAATGGAPATGGGPCTPPDPLDSSAAYLRALDLAPGSELSGGFRVSGDGTVVVGAASYVGMGARAFRWTEAGGIELLDPEGVSSAADAVSADGSVVVGRRSTELDVGYQSWAVRWANGGSEWLAPELDPRPTGATGVSADGSVVVGYTGSDADRRHRAFRWENGDVEWLVPSEGAASIDPFVSADGRIVVAWSSDGSFRWEQGVGYEIIAPEPHAVTVRGLSADGTTLTGSMTVSDNDAHAFRWRDGVFEDLGKLGEDLSQGNAINADGSVIAGSSGYAMIWDRAHGMRSLAQVLEEACVDLDGFSLQSVWGISDDGRTVVGDCCPGFIARLPEGFDAVP